VKERDLIEQFRLLTGTGSKGLLQGIGDDCAVIRKDDEMVWLLTMDTLVESVHFDSNFHRPEKLGRKAVSVNVSDIAAMGGKPGFVLLSLGLPADFSESWLARFSKGFTEACREYGCRLIGGDTVCSPDRAALTVTVTGEMTKDRVLYRHGARQGDTIWVSGPLGGAAAGLALLQSGKGLDNGQLQELLEAHLCPRARLGLAAVLARSGYVHAMMDLSDGLGTDLSHLCRASNAGARVIAEHLPGHETLPVAADMLGWDPVDWMVSGGEDYELLFTTDPDDSDALVKRTEEHGYTVYPVGTITDGEGVILVRKGYEQNISYKGYDHFKDS
jgi:thiamine-monophosphate kinase